MSEVNVPTEAKSFKPKYGPAPKFESRSDREVFKQYRHYTKLVEQECPWSLPDLDKPDDRKILRDWLEQAIYPSIGADYLPDFKASIEAAVEGYRTGSGFDTEQYVWQALNDAFDDILRDVTRDNPCFILVAIDKEFRKLLYIDQNSYLPWFVPFEPEEESYDWADNRKSEDIITAALISATLCVKDPEVLQDLDIMAEYHLRFVNSGSLRMFQGDYEDEPSDCLSEYDDDWCWTAKRLKEDVISRLKIYIYDED